MSKPTLDVSEVSGNAFSLLGAASRRQKELGWSDERREEFRVKAMSGDYNNLLRCLSEEFELILADEE